MIGNVLWKAGIVPRWAHSVTLTTGGNTTTGDSVIEEGKATVVMCSKPGTYCYRRHRRTESVTRTASGHPSWCGPAAARRSLLVMRESPFSVGADNRTTKGDEAGSRERDEADGRQVSATSSVPAHCSRSTRSRSGPCTLSMPRCRSTGHHLASQRIISIMISSVSGCVSTDWVLIVLLAWHLLWRGYNRQQKEAREPAAAPCCSQHWNLGYVTLDPYY